MKHKNRTEPTWAAGRTGSPADFRNQRGSALIIVLGILLVISVLSASAVMLSQLSNHFSKIASDRGLAAYQAEGVAARIVWLLLADKRKNGNPSLIGFKYEEQDGERYLADGTTKEVHAYEAKGEAEIHDLASGIDISGKTPATNLVRTSNPDQIELAVDAIDYEAFLDKVKDYVDNDDFVRDQGAERGEYLGLDLPNLPRNAPFQFREEIMLIPGCKTFFKADTHGQFSDFIPIPLKGMPDIITDKKNFFSVGVGALLKDGFSKDQVKAILEVRRKWRDDRSELVQLMDERIDSQSRQKLLKEYSFQASGFYKFVVRVKTEEGAARTLIFGVQLSSRPGQDRLNYYTWQMF
jgi:hypothetical protein